MKKLILFLCFLATSHSLRAQLNWDMEIWQFRDELHGAIYYPELWEIGDRQVFECGYFPETPTNPTRQVFQSTDAHGGSFAAKLFTKYELPGLALSGLLSNAEITIDTYAVASQDYENIFHFKNGIDVHQRILTVNAWIKYIPQNNDSGKMLVRAVLAGQGANNTDSIVGEGYTLITTPITSYANITTTILYNDPNVVPDKLQVIFLSSAGIVGTDSSTLFVDDVHIPALSISDSKKKTNSFLTLSPNPSAGTFYLTNCANEKLSWQVYNANGQVVVNNELATNNREDLSNLASGTYFYNVLNSKGEIVQKDKFTIAK